ncbi:MAG: cytochrome c-type biogenesis protein CcmH [Fidelibacterota bacterium]
MHNHSIQFIRIISSVLILPLVLEATTDNKLSSIKESLICTCECSMTVDVCESSMSCSSAKNLTKIAMGLLDKGLNETDILNTFVLRFGEEILSAPNKKGFNLIAWILPFLAFSLAGYGIIVILRKWAIVSPKNLTFIEKVNPSLIDEKYENQLNKALDQLD